MVLGVACACLSTIGAVATEIEPVDLFCHIRRAADPSLRCPEFANASPLSDGADSDDPYPLDDVIVPPAKAEQHSNAEFTGQYGDWLAGVAGELDGKGPVGHSFFDDEQAVRLAAATGQAIVTDDGQRTLSTDATWDQLYSTCVSAGLSVCVFSVKEDTTFAQWIAKIAEGTARAERYREQLPNTLRELYERCAEAGHTDCEPTRVGSLSEEEVRQAIAELTGVLLPASDMVKHASVFTDDIEDTISTATIRSYLETPNTGDEETRLRRISEIALDVIRRNFSGRGEYYDQLYEDAWGTDPEYPEVLVPGRQLPFLKHGIVAIGDSMLTPLIGVRLPGQRIIDILRSAYGDIVDERPFPLLQVYADKAGTFTRTRGFSYEGNALVDESASDSIAANELSHVYFARLFPPEEATDLVAWNRVFELDSDRISLALAPEETAEQLVAETLEAERSALGAVLQRGYEGSFGLVRKVLHETLTKANSELLQRIEDRSFGSQGVEHFVATELSITLDGPLRYGLAKRLREAFWVKASSYHALLQAGCQAIMTPSGGVTWECPRDLP